MTSQNKNEHQRFQHLHIQSQEDNSKLAAEWGESHQYINQPKAIGKNKSILIMLIITSILVIAFAGYSLITSRQAQESQELNQKQTLEEQSSLTFTYPTVGIPEPGKSFNSTRVRPKELAIFDEEINKLFKPYNDTNCEIARVGGSRDGGYLICNNFINKSQAILNFGIDTADEFGCALSSKFSMPNYQYDCTIKENPKCEYKNHSSVYFPICVGSISKTTEKPIFLSLQEIIEKNNLTKKHIILKMDTEGAEFEAFKYFPTQYLNYIDQITMEVHFSYFAREVWGNLQILRTLASKFININYHMNNNVCLRDKSKKNRKLPSIAFEVSLINKKLIQLHSDSRSFNIHPLNVKNLNYTADCQIQE